MLAKGEAWGPGEATYTFSYSTDLAAAGLVAVTRRPDGPPLTVLNWSPVEWDEPLEHETLVVRFASVPAPRQGALSLEDATAAGLRTEPWVNQRYLITYRGEGDPPTLWVRFHQDRVPARGSHRVQLYSLPATSPASRGSPSGAWPRCGTRRRGGGWGPASAWGAARASCSPSLLGLGLVSLGLAGRKLKGLARAHATAPDVLWERDDWEPPRLRLSTFRKPGKVAELSDLEALTLLGLPFQVVLAMVLDLLLRRGRLRREDAGGALPPVGRRDWCWTTSSARAPRASRGTWSGPGSRPPWPRRLPGPAFTRALDRKFRRRWIASWRKGTKPYRGKAEVNIILRKYDDKLYTFLTPVDKDNKSIRDIISIALVRIAQKGNILARQEIIKLVRFTIDEWIECCPKVSRWKGYECLIQKLIEDCIRCYRYSGSFMGYLFKTLEYAGRGLRPIIAYSLDDPLSSGEKRRIDRIGQNPETGEVLIKGRLTGLFETSRLMSRG